MNRQDYIGRCGNCRHFETDSYISDYTKYYCGWYGAYFYPSDSCDHYSETTTSTCYITTIVCDILGYDDDCESLNILRDFRNNVLQKNIKYTPLLMEYDVIGPKISQYIKEDYSNNHDKTLCEAFYQKYIIPTVNLVKDKKDEAAIKKYCEMVTNLKDYFGITDTKIVVDDYDLSCGGHGYLKKILNNNH